METKMKMKRKLFVIVIFLMSPFVLIKMNAQGIYDTTDKTTSNTTDVTTDNGVGVYASPPLRAGGPPPPPGGDPGYGDTPIGEGLLILTALAGGYAIIRKKNAKIKSNEI